MPVVPRVPPLLVGRPFRGSEAVAHGVVTSHRLRGPAFRRLFHDVYVDATTPVTHRLRAVAAAGLIVPGAVVSGPSAAVLWGVDLAGPEDDVELTAPPGSSARRVAGLRVRRARLDPEDVCCRGRVRLTGRVLTAVRVASLLADDEAVVALDRMVVAEMVDLAAVRDRAARPGAASPRVRRICARADGLAGSPQETRVRLLMERAGLPAPVAQYVVRHEGRFVAEVDFAWPGLRVAVEYDGLWHAEAGQFGKDRRRLNRLREAGWTVVFVTAADLRDPLRLVAMIRTALGR
ncbi:endonuclease domain-containing protein [Geodermatophilus sp. SYSU D01186]